MIDNWCKCLENLEELCNSFKIVLKFLEFGKFLDKNFAGIFLKVQLMNLVSVSLMYFLVELGTVIVFKCSVDSHTYHSFVMNGMEYLCELTAVIYFYVITLTNYSLLIFLYCIVYMSFIVACLFRFRGPTLCYFEDYCLVLVFQLIHISFMDNACFGSQSVAGILNCSGLINSWLPVTATVASMGFALAFGYLLDCWVTLWTSVMSFEIICCICVPIIDYSPVPSNFCGVTVHCHCTQNDSIIWKWLIHCLLVI